MESAEIHAYLAEPMRMAQVAAISPSGSPLLGSLWFLFSDGRFWFSSHPTSPLVIAAAAGKQVAVIVDQFDPPHQIRQVRVRGQAQCEPHDPEEVRAIYARYLGSDVAEWPDFFRSRATDPAWTLWSVSPDSGVATSLPDFRGQDIRWQTLQDSPLTD